MPGPYRFSIKDSGERAQFAGGMVRDTADRGIEWSNVHYGPMLYRWATHTTAGRVKYEDPEPGIPNWTLGSEDAMAVWLRAQESFERHQAAWLGGWYDEDHAAAMFFNINLKEYAEQFLTDEERTHCRRIQALRAHEPTPAPMPDVLVELEEEVMRVDVPGAHPPVQLEPVLSGCHRKADCTCPKVTFAHDLTVRELIDRGVDVECAAALHQDRVDGGAQ